MKMIKKENGFTLLEVMMVVAMSGVVLAAFLSLYHMLVRAETSQDGAIAMNQSGRMALTTMEREIRMAGCDPDQTAGASIITADTHLLLFSLDYDDGASNGPDGDCCDANEIIRYALDNDADNNGINDNISSGVQCNLERATGTGCDTTGTLCPAGGGCSPLNLALNIDALNFVYLDANGAQLATPVADPDDIRMIEVTIIARSGELVRGLLPPQPDRTRYLNLQGNTVLVPQNDRFRRLALSTSIKVRNAAM